MIAINNGDGDELSNCHNNDDYTHKYRITVLAMYLMTVIMIMIIDDEHENRDVNGGN